MWHRNPLKSLTSSLSLLTVVQSASSPFVRHNIRRTCIESTPRYWITTAALNLKKH